MPPPTIDPPSSSSCPHHLHLHATPQPTSPPPPPPRPSCNHLKGAVWFVYDSVKGVHLVDVVADLGAFGLRRFGAFGYRFSSR
ncbi:hypothetical protein Tco_0301680, partial [Tanacetum coccineum]